MKSMVNNMAIENLHKLMQNTKSPSIVEVFVATHEGDVPEAKYKLGQLVEYDTVCAGNGGTEVKTGIILAVNNTGDGIEYAISTHCYLLWEQQIIKIIQETTEESFEM